MSKKHVKAMVNLITSLPIKLLRQLHRFVTTGGTGIVAIGFLVLVPLILPSAALADRTGNWNLDDGSGHRLGAMLFERSDVDSPSGLRLRLNAESDGLKMDHARPVVLSDGQDQNWSLDNLSQELLATAGGAIPVGSSQYDAGCLNPVPRDGISMKIMVPSSEGDLNFALAPGQVQTLHALTEACAN